MAIHDPGFEAKGHKQSTEIGSKAGILGLGWHRQHLLQLGISQRRQGKENEAKKVGIRERLHWKQTGPSSEVVTSELVAASIFYALPGFFKFLLKIPAIIWKFGRIWISLQVCVCCMKAKQGDQSFSCLCFRVGMGQKSTKTFPKIVKSELLHSRSVHTAEAVKRR